jgi:hypothetical protein
MRYPSLRVADRRTYSRIPKAAWLPRISPQEKARTQKNEQTVTREQSYPTSALYYFCCTQACVAWFELSVGTSIRTSESLRLVGHYQGGPYSEHGVTRYMSA